MFLVLVVVLFPLVYLLNSRLALIFLAAAIGWTFYQRTRPSSAGRRPPKRSSSDEPQYQAGYEN
jgi:hypothetical protein